MCTRNHSGETLCLNLLPNTCTLSCTIMHINNPPTPTSVSHQHTHCFEEPINTDGDMYAAHICHMPLPWQHQLPREARFWSCYGIFFFRIANYLCAERLPPGDTHQNSNAPPFDLISGLNYKQITGFG